MSAIGKDRRRKHRHWRTINGRNRLQSDPGCQLLLYSLIQPNSDPLAHFLTDDSPDFRFYRQHMCPVTHRHERTSEWTTVDTALDINQSASSKEFDGLRPDHISPSALLRTLLQFGCERSSH
jgi:hypothetical protein